MSNALRKHQRALGKNQRIYGNAAQRERARRREIQRQLEAAASRRESRPNGRTLKVA